MFERYTEKARRVIFFARYETIERQKPFRAELEDDVWTVRGSLTEGCTTGVVVARISKADGAVLETGREQ
jgi:hypothetical protein